MNIAFLVNEFPSLSETFILNQITGLIDAGNKVDIYARNRDGSDRIHNDVYTYKLLDRTSYVTEIPVNKLKRLLLSLNIIAKNLNRRPVAILNSLNFFKHKRKALALSMIFEIAKFFKDYDYDVINCHFGPNGNYAVFLREIGAIKGKVITTFHGYDITRVASNNSKIYKELFKKGDLFLPISNYFKTKLIELGCDSNKIIVHRMGIDIDRFTFRQRKLKRNEKIRILSVARLVEKKGLEYGIKAITEVLSHFPFIEYKIVGDGPLKNNLLNLIRDLDLHDKVEILGWKEQSEVIKLMYESHIFLAPSVTASDGDQEGIPVVLMEAMATGLPVISTVHSGIPELINNEINGFLVPERDVNILAEKIVQIIKRPEIIEVLSVEGRKKIESDFNVKKQNNKLMEIFRYITN